MTMAPAAATRGASAAGGGGAGREQGDVEPVVGGGVGVLDRELLVAEGERAAGRAGRGEEPELVERERPLGQDPDA